MRQLHPEESPKPHCKAASPGLHSPHMGFPGVLSPGKAVLDVVLEQGCGQCGPYVLRGCLCLMSPCASRILCVLCAPCGCLAPSPGHLPSRWTASKGMVRSGPAEMPYSCLRRSWAPRAMTTKWPGPVGAALSCSPGGGGQWADQVWTALASSRVVNTHVGTSAAVRLKT